MRSPSLNSELKVEACHFPHRLLSSSLPATDRSAVFPLVVNRADLDFYCILTSLQVRRQGRKSDSPPKPKTIGVGLSGPIGKNDLATEDIEAKILANSRLGGVSSYDIVNPIIVSIKTSERMRDQLLNQEIESRLLAEFAPKLVKVVFNDGSSPVKIEASEGPFVSFAVDEGKSLKQEFVGFDVKRSKY